MTTTAQLAAGLLAENASTAMRAAGPCSVCDHAILPGDRFAVAVADGKLMHVGCAARLLLRLRRPVIR